MSRIAKIGLWGGVGGGDRDIQRSPIRLVDVGVYTNGIVINALQFSYMDDTGEVHKEGPWGNIPTGQRPRVIELAPGNYLQEISGTFGSYCNMNVLKSLKFVINSGEEYQYGQATGEAFTFTIPVLQEGKIVAFFARSGDLLDALGVYIMQSRATKIGLLGGEKGHPRDIQRPPIRLVEVLVYTNGNVINALKFSYVDDDGKQHTEGPWGVTTGQNAIVIELAPGNYLQEISGTYGPYGNVEKCITSLKFVTNEGREYKYGQATGEAFKIPVSQEGKIVAFFGRAGDLLDAMGVYILP